MIPPLLKFIMKPILEPTTHLSVSMHPSYDADFKFNSRYIISAAMERDAERDMEKD